MNYKDLWVSFKDSVIRPAKDKKNMNRIGMTISNNYILPFLIILIDLGMFFLFNYIINSFLNLTYAFTNQITDYGSCFRLTNIFPDFDLITGSATMALIYSFFIAVIAILDGMYIYQMKASLSDDYFNQGQKGDSRFKTIEEIQKAYKEVPDKDIRFPGCGGTIVARYKDKLYIDDKPVNNLVIGMTGSGKDEFYVFPTIDINSRAEQQTSMVVFDPKTESYRSSAKTLEARGYDVYFLNLDQPIKSMGYNPLELITKYYKEGNIDDAEMLADAFAYSIYTPDDSKLSGNEKFFNESAASILSGLVLAHIKDCLDEDERLNEMRLKKIREKQRAFVSLTPDQQAVIRDTYTDVTDCIDNDDIRYIPDDIDIASIAPIQKYEKCINIYSILNMLIELSGEQIPNTEDTMLDEYFRIRPPLDAGKIRYSAAMVAGDRTKGSILSTLINGLNVFKNRAIAKMTAESTLDFDDLGFGERPVAVFLGVPDYDRSKWFLATIFIRQAYYYLAQKCARMNGKCKRHVKFICNEFGNMPPLDDIGGTVTVSRGRNISFDMYIQAFSQMAEKYGEKTQETIESNCGNIIYILTSSKDTSEKISDLLGHKTIKMLQRTGPKLGLNKHFVENLDQVPLLYPEDLRKFKEGECVVIPTMHRKDLQGNDIKEDAIYNSKETGTHLKYRYQYLTDTFPNPDTISLDEVNRFSCADINPDNLIWDSNLSFISYRRANSSEATFGNLSQTNQKNIISLLKKEMGSDWNPDMFAPNVPLRKILAWIQPYPINDFVKETIMDMLLMSEERRQSSA